MRVLVIDDDLEFLTALRRALEERGYEVDASPTGEAALHRPQPPEVVLLDPRLGDRLLQRFTQLEPAPAVIILSERADISAVVEAMQDGAHEYLSKPVSVTAVVELLEHIHGQRPGSTSAAEQNSATAEIIGESSALHRAKSLITRIARSPTSTVLLTGESGTGKDLAARAIHAASTRADGPFVNVTCSALPANLLESELFGHERGAFTGAKRSKIGLVEAADGGTLFLDEIGELELGLQAKLLRFLEAKRFRRVGGTRELVADVRVIAATNCDVPAAVRGKRFREDLYYRLAVLTIDLPPLRERSGDVPMLAHHFLGRFAALFDRRPLAVNSRAMQRLEDHSWPGNIRELKNTIERAVLLASSQTLQPADFELTPAAPATTRADVELPARGVNLRELERTLVRQALFRSRGNVTQAGRLLGLNRDQVRYRVNKFGLQDEVEFHRSAG